MKNALLSLSQLRRGLLALLTALFCAVGALSAAETLSREFDLPADAAERTLKLFAAQSGLEVLFVTAMTDGVRTTAVRGTMVPIEAARRLLAGTKLSAAQDGKTGAVIISQAAPPEGQEKNVESRRANDATTALDAEANLTGNISGRVSDASTSSFLPGAEIRLRQTGQGAVSSRDGRFVLRGIPAGSYIVDASYVGYSTRSFPLLVTVGQTSEIEAQLTPEVIRLETFRVEGAREGQARALSEQRAATNLKNLVSADSIGNFPDVNAAAALKRMPGISTVRQRGEDRDITIRGAAPNLNSITIDGVSVLSNQVDGRTVSMDVYPAEQLAGIEITKSVTPDMDGDSIGGAINLRTKSAFDARDRLIAANAYWQYNDMAEASSYRTGVNFSDVVGEKEEWGVQFSASFARRIALEENGEAAGWALRSGTAGGTPYSGYTPNNLPFNNVDIERERTGGSLSLERKLGDATLLYLRASHNEFVERNGRPRVVVQAVGNVSAGQPVISEGDRLVQYTSTAIRAQRVVNPREFTDTGTSIALGGRTLINEWNVELVGSVARGT
ncbi:MAG TPA: carboxypeptidase-like regulatory domain-containing protein, partial [Opitutus sp.]|nr:carboxypeptidase-like regulatory domain-containing protein [Opitutus sp.]